MCVTSRLGFQLLIFHSFSPLLLSSQCGTGSTSTSTFLLFAWSLACYFLKHKKAKRSRRILLLLLDVARRLTFSRMPEACVACKCLSRPPKQKNGGQLVIASCVHSIHISMIPPWSLHWSVFASLCLVIERAGAVWWPLSFCNASSSCKDWPIK